MALIVQKYGGAVLSDIAKIRAVAEVIADLSQKGNRIVAVVSAMGYTTDDLARLASSVSLNPPKREMDMLLSVGERITMSLLAMAIGETGKAKAISYTGSQVGIITDNRHSEARIVAVRGDRLLKALEEGYVVVVAGFQGVSMKKEITTLGRGGSDTTAVALAAVLGADRCDLVKEVPGVFSADPTAIPESVPIPEMDYAAARGISLGGARIMKEACIEIAQRAGIELRVGNLEQFTVIRQKAEKPFFSVALKKNLLKLTGEFELNPDEVNYDDDIIVRADEITIFRDASKPIPAAWENLSRDEECHLLTVVGDEAVRALRWIREDVDVNAIEYASCQAGVAKIIFKSDSPDKILRRIHKKMKTFTPE